MVPARPRRRGPRRRARVRGADLAVELREQVGVALLVQLAPVDELPRAWEAEQLRDVEVDQPAWNSSPSTPSRRRPSHPDVISTPRSTLVCRREARYFSRPSRRRTNPGARRAPSALLRSRISRSARRSPATIAVVGLHEGPLGVVPFEETREVAVAALARRVAARVPLFVEHF